MKSDYADELLKELEGAENLSAADFCTEWKTKWRAVAIAAQSILNFVFPAGAKILGLLISVADKSCGI